MTTRGPVLAADIGGTNARFAVIDAGVGGAAPTVKHQARLRARDYVSVAAAAHAFLESYPGPAPTAGGFAVAGPVGAEEISFTNSPWRFTTAELAADVGLDRLTVVNDWAAVARGVQVTRGEADRVTIIDGAGDPGAPVVALGPGTGLGLGVAAPNSVLATEGGHVAFAPMDDLEDAILQFLRAEYGFVSFETLLSGPGLVNIHRALCHVEGVTREFLGSEEITQAAIARDPDLPIAARTVEVFCTVLGTYASDAVVITGARGGVALGGGILPSIADLLTASPFKERFRQKGPMSEYLEDVPVTLILDTDRVALIGAATLAFDGEPA